MAISKSADLLLKIAHMKSLQDALAAQIATTQEELMVDMNARGLHTVSRVLDNGDTIKGTLVAPSRVSIDADRLKNVLSAAQWKKVTTLVLDKAKLEAAAAINVVDPNMVAACSTITDTKPYIKVSGKYSPQDVAMAFVSP